MRIRQLLLEVKAPLQGALQLVEGLKADAKLLDAQRTTLDEIALGVQQALRAAEGLQKS